MSKSQRRNPSGKRSDRPVVYGLPSARTLASPSESDQELVIIPERERSPERFTTPTDAGVDPESRSSPIDSEEEPFPLEPRIMATRLRYTKFRGNGKEDVDDWLGEFEATAEANQEDPASRRRVFHGLLKGEALKWYQDVPDDNRNDWNQLKEVFLRTFREVGGEARALGRLSKMSMRPGESVRKYGQRVKALIQKLTTDVAASIQVEWYVAGLPEKMGFHIRQSRPATLREAIETAQNYENSAHSLRKSIRKSEKMERRTSKKYEKKKKRRQKFSDSGTSSSGSETTSSTSTSGNSSSEAEISNFRRAALIKHDRLERDRKPIKVKIEDEDSKKMMKTIQDSLEAIKVNLADNRKPRRIVPTTRTNVWCTRCGRPGHFPSECPQGTQKQVHFVDEEGVYYTLPMEEDYEEDTNPVYQIQTGYGRGKAPQQLIRTTAINRSGMAGSSQGTYPPSRFPPGCCYNCGSPQHYANSCPHNKYGQGAPLTLPCQNCQEYGHPSSECPKPQQLRPVYKQVEILPREQTALNYGSTAGIENPEK